MSLFSIIGDICKVAVHAVCQVALPGPVGALLSTGIGFFIDEVSDDPEEEMLGDPGADVADYAEAGANIFNALQGKDGPKIDMGMFRV